MTESKKFEPTVWKREDLPADAKDVLWDFQHDPVFGYAATAAICCLAEFQADNRRLQKEIVELRRRARLAEAVANGRACT